MNYWKRIYEVENILTAVFWEMKDNKDYPAEAKRLDTILGKLWELDVRLKQKEKEVKS